MATSNLAQMVMTDQIPFIGGVLLIVFMIFVVAFIVYCERSQRRIPIQYARRVVGRREVAGGMTYFPLRLNSAGVIPPIFATSLLLLPQQIAQFSGSQAVADFANDYLAFGTPAYNLVFAGMIMFFAYFYTGIMINPEDVADNIKRNGGYIPGIRPGKKTAEYIDRVVNRITLIGAIYLAVVCVLPNILITRFSVPFYFGGTALLICVGVAMDTVGQVEAHLVARNYDSFAQGTRIRGRGR